MPGLTHNCYGRIYLLSVLTAMIINWHITISAFDHACQVQWIIYQPKEFTDTKNLSKSCKDSITQDKVFLTKVEAKWPSFYEEF